MSHPILAAAISLSLSLWLTFLALHAAGVHLVGRAEPETVNVRFILAALAWGVFYYVTHP